MLPRGAKSSCFDVPYFIFRIDNHREYRCLAQFDAYRDARRDVRTRRTGIGDDSPTAFRMIFADDAGHGELLLRARRERPPAGDD